MSSAWDDPSNTRVLVLAPTARDAAVTEKLLAEARVPVHTCPTLPGLCHEARSGAAVLLLTDEALTPEGVHCLRELVEDQPPWSDLPILVLTSARDDAERHLIALESLGNITLLDRPIRVAMLLSAVRTAIRARKRQYQLREHLEEQERTRDALREADRRKDEFLAMLAHELRNPLAAIVASAAVLDVVADSAPVRRQQRVIDRQSRHTARLLDDLLDVSRITSGRIELRREHLDLGTLVSQVAGSCRETIESRGHRLTVALPQEPLCVNADPARLEQILTNLLTNASKYMPDGGEIAVSVTRAAEQAVISVRDKGVGLAPEFLPKVFDLFVQSERSLARSEGGVGIGLTMVKRLVELHGGSVEARSDGLDKGSEFIVRLPVVQYTRCVEAHAKDSSLSGPWGAPNRVLIVEDNRDAAETMADLLGLWGHEVQVAHDGEKALRAAEQFRPEVVLLDIGLPGMDGYEVARRMRKTATGEGLILIALTGYGHAEAQERAAQAGFDHHMTKPVDPGSLQDLLRGLTPAPTR